MTALVVPVGYLLLKGNITDTLTLNFERSKQFPFVLLAPSFPSFVELSGTGIQILEKGNHSLLSSSAAGGRELADRSEFGFKAVRDREIFLSLHKSDCLVSALQARDFLRKHGPKVLFESRGVS